MRGFSAGAFALLLMLNCVAAVAVHAEDLPLVPQRIVSLDYCADQFVLGLVERERIVALSTDSMEPFSYLREQARGLPQVRAVTEDVLLLRPDLVVTSYGGSPGMDRLLSRAGVAVLRVGWIEDLAGVRDNLQAMGAGLGNTGAAQILLDDFDRRLTALAERAPGSQPRAFYVTPGGVTGGPGTLIDELLAAAGLTNFNSRPGWQALPLERLAYERPDVVVTASFVQDQHPWSAARHPLLVERMKDLPTVSLPGAWTACGAWFLIDAIEALAAVAG